jgi:penicillin-binding protein 2B
LKDRIRKRALLFMVFLIFVFSLLGARIYYIQTVEAADLVKKAQSFWQKNAKISPERGKILDRNGVELAYNAAAYTVIAYPKDITDPKNTTSPNEAATKLGRVLGMSSTKILNKITQTDQYQVELRNEGWKISAELAEKVKALELKGIDLVEERKRYYPLGEMAANVIGYTDKEGKAKLGMEDYANEMLSGSPGSFQYTRDGKGFSIPNGLEDYKPALNGSDVVLTLDTKIQHYVEQALDEAEAMYQPKTMMAIVADPKTGEVLGMSVRPNYNPNQYWSFESFQDFRNTTVSYTYEPGSTFKIVTLAAAIEEGLFTPNESYKSGRISGTFGTIRDHNGGRGWGEKGYITYLEGVQRSSNVAFVKMGFEGLGKDRLYSYIDKFGFGQNTGIDLPNESEGQFAHRPYARDVANTSFGQGVSVTALQQVAAVSAIANGGKLMKPYIIKEIRNEETGKLIKVQQPQVVREVVSEETAQKTRLVLEKVVEDPIKGTGHRAFIEGYRVAGKTGTAQLIENGQYSADKFIASFIGFAPADDPRLVIYVMVQEPDIKGNYGGGSVAAPIFREIMLNSLRHLRIEPQEDRVTWSQTAKVQAKPLPKLVDRTLGQAQNTLKEQGLTAYPIGGGKKVQAQFPAPGTKIYPDQRIYLITQPVDQLRVPSFSGMSLLDAMELCSIMGMNCTTEGNGYVTEQSLPAGSSAKGASIKLKLASPSQQNTGTEVNSKGAEGEGNANGER